ncbi:hypothetical protein B0H13DRAFT_1855123 [Mycena leptocephala]|nr:hypothetical protein B0H13DRAFT_1855123 [Mycena leptocephala]
MRHSFKFPLLAVALTTFLIGAKALPTHNTSREAGSLPYPAGGSKWIDAVPELNKDLSISGRQIGYTFIDDDAFEHGHNKLIVSDLGFRDFHNLGRNFNDRAAEVAHQCLTTLHGIHPARESPPAASSESSLTTGTSESAFGPSAPGTAQPSATQNTGTASSTGSRTPFSTASVGASASGEGTPLGSTSGQDMTPAGTAISSHHGSPSDADSKSVAPTTTSATGSTGLSELPSGTGGVSGVMTTSKLASMSGSRTSGAMTLPGSPTSVSLTQLGSSSTNIGAEARQL